MRILIQRVSRASVSIHSRDGKNSDTVRSTGEGLLLLVGIGKGDDEYCAEYLAEKIYNLRIFERNGKFDLSISDINGEVLAVPQFTLFACTDKGRRPDFTDAEKPERAEELFDYFCDILGRKITCKKGFFGERMDVELVNSGPVTIMVEK